MHNLFRMSSLASLEGHYFKPRIDRELLSTYGEGLIATTGCPRRRDPDPAAAGAVRRGAGQAAAEFRDIFGAENYFCELMDHGLPIEQTVRDGPAAAGQGAEPAAGRDQRPALHPRRGRQGPRGAALRAVRLDPGRPQPVQVRRRRLLPQDAGRADAPPLPRAARGLRQHPADRRDVRGRLRAGRGPLHAARSPARRARTSSPGSSRRSSAACTSATRTASRTTPASRRTYETEVIVGKGYPGYFLVVADFINWAKDNGIRVGPGRGSGAGSMCAYAMRITDLDPVEHGLIFERFLNPERPSMPDFDVDFDERRRGEVIRYVTEKYGSERVAQIVTYGTIKAKQALKDSARVLGFPFAMGERLTKAMPPAVMGKDIPLAGIFDPRHKRYSEAEEFRKLHETDAEAQEVVETALGLEGLKRQWGVHAAGVIMSSEPLIDLIPIMRREQDGADHHPVRLPELRGARPGQDGLPRPAQPDHPGRRASRTSQANRRRGPRARDPATLDDPADLRAAGPRRHPRRVPARRRAACARCCARCGRTTSRTSPRSSRSTGPARWAPTRTTSTPTARTAASRSRRSTRSWPRPLEEILGDDLRPDRLPGAGHGDRAEGRRLLPRRRRPAAPGDGQEEEGRAGRAVRSLRVRA